MKKVALVSIIILLFNLPIFCAKEAWLLLGGEFTNSLTMKSSENGLKTNFNSIGATLTYFNFNENDVGLIVHDSFHIPYSGRIRVPSQSIDLSFSSSDIKILIGLLVGPAFKTKLGEESVFYIGIGPNIQQLSIIEDLDVYDNPNDSLMNLLFGLGVNAGVKTNIGEKMVLNTGVVTNMNFYSYNMANSYFGSSILNISFSPYIGIGYKTK